ncbi:O-methyltransferase [Glutamicibacter sp.]|uniref:O-methyltransferase n=1 Tax=Glutamicibacter sp. TaxID=1931995 RepID=UPI002B493597|nr:class I SAM-dependent methyltransferase [Glutamicibacter sp.]HJX77746.1 class I SAM-dependent methyltransferase [Glutamicibacter sp.]
MPSMNPELLASWGFSQNQRLERDHVLAARERAADLGVGCIDPAGRSMLTLLCTLRAPHSIVEIGSGVGVASMAMLEAMGATGTLTAIESDLEHANAMRQGLRDAGILSARVRIINERAENVLSRLADHAYDLVLIDASAENLLDYVAEAKRLVGANGVIILNNAFDEHRLARPAVRRASTVATRDALRLLREDPKLQTHLFPSEQGLFVATVIAGHKAR